MADENIENENRADDGDGYLDPDDEEINLEQTQNNEEPLHPGDEQRALILMAQTNVFEIFKPPDSCQENICMIICVALVAAGIGLLVYINSNSMDTDV